MAHCGAEEAAQALAQIDVDDTADALDTAEIVLDLANADLMACEAEH